MSNEISMRACDKPFCKQWAQYHAIFQTKDKERLRFCQQHKEEHEREYRGSPKVKYAFVGAERNAL